MSVTDGDRAEARALWGHCMDHEGERGAVELIAQALADERERARESTLRDVADELAALMPELDWADHFREQAEAFRRAAEESQ